MKEITVVELKSMIDNKADFQLVDVREQHEFDEANIAGELIPMGELMQQPDRLSRDKKVVIHCRSGARSGSVINAMEKQFGFDNLYNLKGGIVAYINEIGPAVERG